MQTLLTVRMAEVGREVIESVEDQVRQAVADTSADMAEVAVNIARARQRPGSHRKMMEISSLTVFKYETGYEGGIKSPAWYAYFQSDGTLGSRTKKLRASTLRRRESPSGQLRYAKVKGRKGITPLKFFDEAAKVGRRNLKERVERIVA